MNCVFGSDALRKKFSSDLGLFGKFENWVVCSALPCSVVYLYISISYKSYIAININI